MIASFLTVGQQVLILFALMAALTSWVTMSMLCPSTLSSVRRSSTS